MTQKEKLNKAVKTLTEIKEGVAKMEKYFEEHNIIIFQGFTAIIAAKCSKTIKEIQGK